MSQETFASGLTRSSGVIEKDQPVLKSVRLDVSVKHLLELIDFGERTQVNKEEYLKHVLCGFDDEGMVKSLNKYKRKQVILPQDLFIDVSRTDANELDYATIPYDPYESKGEKGQPHFLSEIISLTAKHMHPESFIERLDFCAGNIVEPVIGT